jgi:hypothetical protein
MVTDTGLNILSIATVIMSTILAYDIIKYFARVEKRKPLESNNSQLLTEVKKLKEMSIAQQKQINALEKENIKCELANNSLMLTRRW